MPGGKRQGTPYESHIRKVAETLGRSARRRALSATKHEPDVEIDGSEETLPALFWKHYQPGNTRRKTSSYVVLREQDFWKLMALDDQEQYAWLIQAKAAQRVSVAGIMQGLIGWMKNHADLI